MTLHRVEMELAGRTLSIETGHLAKQADASVVVQYGETIVLGTVVHAEPRPGIDFFPLTVDYREKYSAAGKFAGGFRKREGAPSTKEVLTMRNIDRPIRPLFPKGYFDEVQIQCWVLSYDGQNEPDVLAGIAASAALHLSTVPFLGPVGNVRVGRIDTDNGHQFVVMPTKAQAAYSDLDLLLCGHTDGLNMIEVGAQEIPEQDMLKAIAFGNEYVLKICKLIEDLRTKAGKPKQDFDGSLPAEVVSKVSSFGPALKAAKTSEGTKLERYDAVKQAKKKFIADNFPEPDGNAGVGVWEKYRATRAAVGVALHDLEEQITREIIRGGKRTDGRAFDQLRKIECKAGLLPRVHGSGLFTRGETQALVTAVLGTGKDEQLVDGLDEEYSEKFYLHYNFPPFSVGEAKRITGPGRREIGHGKLAERALAPILPDVDAFPYTVRLVSDILESNGSSSMASACGGTLALMDAGVPIKAPVAGISIGIITADDASQKDVFLTDIQGEEDHFGDMDFKVCGTREGITAIQLDLKTRGLTMAQIEKTFELAHKNRLQILDLIEAEIPKYRDKISDHAPRILTTHIHPEKIGKLIGPGGKTIRAMQEATGAVIDVQEDGTVYVSAVGAGKAEKAVEEIEKLCAEVKVGTIYTGRVSSIKDFGAFVELAPGTDGLCHISELAEGYVQNVNQIVKTGDTVRVKVILVDDSGRIKLSRRQALAEGEDDGLPKSGGERPAGGSGGGNSGDGERGERRDRGGDRGGRGRGRGGSGGHSGGGGGGGYRSRQDGGDNPGNE